MLYLCCAMVFDVAIFTMGLTMSIIDVNKYNFGLYLVLISVVAFSLLVALWVAKPKFCQTPHWAIHVYEHWKTTSRVDQSNPFELQKLMEHHKTDEVMRSIRGIPQLIQAIQYSLEANMATTTNALTSHSADSAIESAMTTNLYPPDHSQTSWIENEEWTNPKSRVDVKRQSIFVVFPYSETLPVDPKKLQIRRTSSEHDLSRLKEGDIYNKFKENVKKESQNRRPSIEVRYVGLQSIWMAKMAKH